MKRLINSIIKVFLNLHSVAIHEELGLRSVKYVEVRGIMTRIRVNALFFLSTGGGKKGVIPSPVVFFPRSRPSINAELSLACKIFTLTVRLGLKADPSKG